jgi:hypothetical protein
MSKAKCKQKGWGPGLTQSMQAALSSTPSTLGKDNNTNVNPLDVICTVNLPGVGSGGGDGGLGERYSVQCHYVLFLTTTGDSTTTSKHLI